MPPGSRLGTCKYLYKRMHVSESTVHGETSGLGARITTWLGGVLFVFMLKLNLFHSVAKIPRLGHIQLVLGTVLTHQKKRKRGRKCGSP
jgi:hypothetical protein